MKIMMMIFKKTNKRIRIRKKDFLEMNVMTSIIIIIYYVVSKMMQGFGEVSNPREDTLELMEQYTIEFITNVTKRTLARSLRSKYNTIQLRDLLKVIEEDEKKFLRVPYLLTGLEAIDVGKIKN